MEEKEIRSAERLAVSAAGIRSRFETGIDAFGRVRFGAQPGMHLRSHRHWAANIGAVHNLCLPFTSAFE
ncbi:MAG: hypothetical protein P4M09_06155 [Devosia sp.]|nr:hypothetical protein [Devosia sp.]